MTSSPSLKTYQPPPSMLVDRIVSKPKIIYSYPYSMATASFSPPLELIVDLGFGLCIHLVVIQERSSLLVRRNSVSSEANLLAKDAWDSDDKGAEEQSSHDRKGKDPLESDDLSQELTNTEGSCQDTECKAHGIVLESNEKEETID